MIRKALVVVALLGACKSSDPKPAATGSGTGSAPAPVAGPKADYLTLATTATGRTAFTRLADAHTVAGAIRAGVRGLPGLDGAPTLTGGFADQEGRRGGGAFTASVGGKPVAGQVLVGIDDGGASVVVLYASPDAPAAEWSALAAALPATMTMHATPLGGGTGTIDVPDGWKLTASGPIGDATVDGPAGQRVVLGAQLEVITPDSQMAQMIRASGAPAQVLIAKFAAPDVVLPKLAPQINKFAKRGGLPTESIDEILEASPLTPAFPNGKAQALYLSSTVTKQGVAQKYRTRAQVESYSIGNGGWAMYFGAVVTAPDPLFDRDLPTMIAIVKSWKLDDAKVAANSRAMIAEQNRRFAAFEDSMRANSAAFESYLHSVQTASTVRSQSNDDFDEVIRGYRAVEDTTTGDRTYQDLGTVTDLVDQLNAHEPGRYREIPLRDE